MFNSSELESTVKENNNTRSLFPSLSLKRRSLHCTRTRTIQHSEKVSIMSSRPAAVQLSSTETPAVSQTTQQTARVIATPLSSSVEQGQVKINNVAEHSYAAAAVTSVVDAPATDDTKEKESDTSSSESSDSSSNASDEEIKLKSTAAEDVKTSPRIRAQPKKYIEDYVTLQTPKGTPPSKRLTPKRASTSKGRTTKEPLRQTEEKRKSDASLMQSIAGKKRGRGCGQCPGCLRDDCGTCPFCLDKPKFGGPGKKKQRCALRNCSNFMSTRTGTRKSQGGATPGKSSNTPSTSAAKATTAAKATSAASADKATSTPKQVSKTPLTSKEVINKVPPLIKDPPTSSTGATPTSSTPAPKPVPLVSGLSKVTPQAQVLTTLDLQAFIAKATKMTPLPVPIATKTVTPILPATITPSTVGTAPATKDKSEDESSKSTGTAVSTDKGTPSSAAKMKCIQCGRERKLSVARTSNFCTQRCIIQWMEEHPNSSLKEAMGEDMSSVASNLSTATTKPGTSPATQESKSGKPISRALKNLQIDMAPPGTKLPPPSSEESSSSSEEEAEANKPQVKNGPTLRATKRAASNQVPKTTPTTGTKRQTTAQQPASVKKVAKSPANGAATPKSVTFNLSANTPISSSEPTGAAISIVPLDRLSGPLGNALLASAKKTSLFPPVSTAKGLPADIRSWTVDEVVLYFKSTPDCKEYAEMFQEQEVDGTALLLLSHENLVKCLGIKLGRAVKIMAHVEELKLQFEKQSTS